MSTTPRNFQRRTVQLNRRVSPRAIENIFVIRWINPGMNDTDALEYALAEVAANCGDPKAVEAARREWKARRIEDGKR